MTTYTITEKQSVNSEREGVEVQAKTFSDAKRKASKMQAFYGTIVTIEECGVLLATKANGKWTNAL